MTINLAPPTRRRDDRRLAIIAAAESLFLEHGYDAVSLAAIIKESGGSLATVYELFGNKLGLLRAVFDRGNAESPPCVGDAAFADRSPAERLRLFAADLHAYVTSPRVIALTRIVILEAMRNPEFARDFHRDVHMRFVDEVAETFARWTIEGKARIDDPQAAAELFLAMTCSDAQFRILARAGDVAVDAATLGWRLQPFLDYFEIR